MSTANVFVVPSTPLSEAEMLQLGDFEAALAKINFYNIDLGYSYLRKIPEDDFTIIMASPNRLSPTLLLQYEKIARKVFPNPTATLGSLIVDLYLRERVWLPVMAVKEGHVLAISAVKLCSTRSAKAGMNDATRQSVVEFTTLATREEYRKRHLASTLTRVCFTHGADAIKEIVADAVTSRKGPLLARKSDETVGADLEFDADRLLEFLLDEETSLMRVFYENPLFVARIREIAQECGYGPSSASKALIERMVGNISICRESPEAQKISIFLDTCFMESGRGIIASQQLIFCGPDGYLRAKAVGETIAQLTFATQESEEPEEESWVNQLPLLTILPETAEKVVDLSGLSETAANEEVEKIQETCIVRMPVVPSVMGAWKFIRTGTN